MSLTNFLDVGVALSGGEIPWYKGKYSSSIGSSFSFSMGQSYSHTFGGKASLTCDPVSTIFGGAATNPLAAILMGMNGAASFSYGSSTSAYYVGPKFAISRAPVATKNSSYDFTTPRRAAEAGAKPGAKDPVDFPTAQLVGGLSLLLCATAFAFDLAIHIEYPKFGSSSKNDVKEYGNTPAVLRALSITLVDRMMAVLRLVEIKASYANQADQDVKAGEAQIEEAAAAVKVLEPPVEAAAARAAAAADNFTDATKSAAEALTG